MHYLCNRSFLMTIFLKVTRIMLYKWKHLGQGRYSSWLLNEVSVSLSFNFPLHSAFFHRKKICYTFEIRPSLPMTSILYPSLWWIFWKIISNHSFSLYFFQILPNQWHFVDGFVKCFESCCLDLIILPNAHEVYTHEP